MIPPTGLRALLDIFRAAGANDPQRDPGRQQGGRREGQRPPTRDTRPAIPPGPTNLAGSGGARDTTQRNIPQRASDVVGEGLSSAASAIGSSLMSIPGARRAVRNVGEYAEGRVDPMTVHNAMAPISRLSAGAGAIAQGRNPFPAMEQYQNIVPEYTDDGEFTPARPTLDRVLVEDYGIHPVAAMVGDALLTPDPTGAGRAADLVPLMGLLGPRGLRMLLKKGNQVDFVPAGELMPAQGNQLRRTPREQSEFRRELVESGGIDDPVIVEYDPQTNRYAVGEGNHRMLAASEADSPVPTTVIRGRVKEGEGAPLPPEGVENLQRLAAEGHGYTPGSANPSQLGFTRYDPESVINYARQQADENLIPFMQSDVDEIREQFEQIPGLMERMPAVGRRISRPSQAQPDFTPTLQRLAEQAETGEDAEQYVTRILQEMGPDDGRDFLMRESGLTPREFQQTLEGWTGSRISAADILGDPSISGPSRRIPGPGGFPESPAFNALGAHEQIEIENLRKLIAAAASRQSLSPEEYRSFVARIERLNPRLTGIFEQFPEDEMQNVIEEINRNLAEASRFLDYRPPVGQGNAPDVIDGIERWAASLDENDLARIPEVDLSPMFNRLELIRSRDEFLSADDIREYMSDSGIPDEMIEDALWSLDESLFDRPEPGGIGRMPRLGERASNVGAERGALGASELARFGIENFDPATRIPAGSRDSREWIDYLAKLDAYEDLVGDIPPEVHETVSREVKGWVDSLIERAFDVAEDRQRGAANAESVTRQLLDEVEQMWMVNSYGLEPGQAEELNTVLRQIDPSIDPESTTPYTDVFHERPPIFGPQEVGSIRLTPEQAQRAASNLDTMPGLGAEFGDASVSDYIAWLVMESGVGDITPEAAFNFLVEQAGLNDGPAQRLVDITFSGQAAGPGGVMPNQVDLAQAGLGADAVERIGTVADEVDELQALMNEGVLTERTVEQANRVFADITSILEDLAPLSRENEEAAEAMSILESLQQQIRRQIDPMGPNPE